MGNRQDDFEMTCPFCGAPALVVHNNQAQYYRVLCTNRERGLTPCGAMGPWRRQEGAAIAAWNQVQGVKQAN